MNDPADHGQRIHPARNRSRSLRRAATDAERELWWHLRRTVPVEGSHFRRQVPITPYIVDFACLRHRLVVEVDGGGHARAAQEASDAARDAELRRRGYRVLRFSNHQVFREVHSVLDTIFAALADGAGRLPSPLRGGVGGGGDGKGRAEEPATDRLAGLPDRSPRSHPPRKGKRQAVPPSGDRMPSHSPTSS